MTLTTGNITDLPRQLRAIARLANIATSDTIFGGARALTLAQRLDAMGAEFNAQDIVADVYGASIGRTLPQYKVCRCPECGQTHLGEDYAYQCCAERAIW